VITIDYGRKELRAKLHLRWQRSKACGSRASGKEVDEVRAHQPGTACRDCLVY